MASTRSELQRVLNQIPEYLLKTCGVGTDLVSVRLKLQFKHEMLLRQIVVHDFDDIADRLVHIDRLERQLKLSARDARQIQKIINESRFQLDVSSHNRK